MSDNLAEKFKLLQEPFPPSAVQFRPGAISKQGTRALALAYIDSRLYQGRLDEVDPAWADSLQATILPDRILVNCRLTILGVTREDVGESPLISRGNQEDNAYTSAVAQAFKRACAKFGLGRYLYGLPQVWADYDSKAKRFTDNGLAALRQAIANRNSDNDHSGPSSSGNGHYPTIYWAQAKEMIAAGHLTKANAGGIVTRNTHDNAINWDAAITELNALKQTEQATEQ